MSKKINFGVDFLFVVRSLQIDEKKLKFDPVTDAASKLFLVDWGLSAEEVDEVNKMFFDKGNSGSLDKFDVTIERLVNHLKKDKPSTERFIIQVAALASLDFNITEMEATFVNMLKDYFDLRKSELETLLQRGTNLAIALNYFGETYSKEKS